LLASVVRGAQPVAVTHTSPLLAGGGSTARYRKSWLPLSSVPSGAVVRHKNLLTAKHLARQAPPAGMGTQETGDPNLTCHWTFCRSRFDPSVQPDLLRFRRRGLRGAQHAHDRQDQADAFSGFDPGTTTTFRW